MLYKYVMAFATAGQKPKYIFANYNLFIVDIMFEDCL